MCYDTFNMFISLSNVMFVVLIFLIFCILLEKLRRKDLEIVNAIEEKEKILAEMFQVPYEEFKASKEVGKIKLCSNFVSNNNKKNPSLYGNILHKVSIYWKLTTLSPSNYFYSLLLVYHLTFPIFRFHFKLFYIHSFIKFRIILTYIKFSN